MCLFPVTLQCLAEGGAVGAGGGRAGHHHHIQSLELLLLQAKTFAHYALDPVSYYRFGRDATGNGDTEPRMSKLVTPHMHSKKRVAFGAALAGDFTQLAPGAQAQGRGQA